MRINWGHGLFIAMAVFIVFIVLLAIKLMSQDSSVVYDDYYVRGLHHDEQMAMERRAALYADSVNVHYFNSKLNIQFPESLHLPINNLRVHMYRPSSSDLDQMIKVDKPVQEHEIRLSINTLVKGKWEAKLTWTDELDSTYYLKRTMFID